MCGCIGTRILNMYSLWICASRFVPYIGIVTILMNDYPKFKVGGRLPGGLKWDELRGRIM